MPRKKNTTKSSPAKIAVKQTAKNKEKRKLKTPMIIKFKLPSMKCSQGPDSQSSILPPTMVMDIKLTETGQGKFKANISANKENPDAQSNQTLLKSKSMPVKIPKARKSRKLEMKLQESHVAENPDSQSNPTLLKSKSMPAKITKAVKRKLDMKAQEFPNAASDAGSKNVNLNLVNTNSVPGKITKKASKKIKAETLKVDPNSQSNLSTVKGNCLLTKVTKLRKPKCKPSASNDLTEGGLSDSQNMSRTKTKIIKTKPTKAEKAKMVTSAAGQPDSQNMSPPKTKIIKTKPTKAEKAKMVTSATAADPESQTKMHPPRTTRMPVKNITKLAQKHYDSKALKIELANEVALAQLGGKPAFEAPPPPKVLKKCKERKERGRKPKQKQGAEEAVDNATANCQLCVTKGPIKTNLKNKVPKKLSAKHSTLDIKVTKNNDVTSKMTMDSTSKKSTKKPKINRSEIIAKQIHTKVKRKYNRRKGKVSNDITSNEHLSPSILKDRRIATVDTSSQTAAGPVGSRKVSLTSTSDCFSWTKDISDSSTTTCVTVCSTDFVRLDNKLPIIKLSNCDNAIKSKSSDCNKVEDSNNMDSDSSEETTKSSSTSQSSSDSDSVSRSLNLSISSVSPAKSHATSAHENSSQKVSVKDEMTKVVHLADKIIANLLKIDIDVLNWLGPESEDEIPDDNFKENIFKVLKAEGSLLAECRETNRIFSYIDTRTIWDSNNTGSPAKCANKENVIEINSLEPACNANSYSSELEDGEIVSNESDNEMDSLKEDDDAMLPPRAEENRKAGDNPQRVEPIYYNDDDDAISLFAESIADDDPFRPEPSLVSSLRRSSGVKKDLLTPFKNTYVPQPIEAYVPQPVLRNPLQPPPPRITYLPSKIVPDAEQGAKAATICEKQNADSTSIYKETDHSKERVGICNVDNEPITFHAPTVNPIFPPIANNQDRVLLMEHVIPQMKLMYSQVFKGVCFSNLMSKCKRIECRYSHSSISVPVVQSRLAPLPENLFLREYMILRAYPDLRRLYRTCFIKECEQRGLTRALIEMAIDAVKSENKNSTENAKFKIYAIETVLLHLNDKCLDDYDDLLMYNFDLKPLCHIFMETLAETQNFSRFKSVFQQLTFFISRNLTRSFALNVASQILERVCILPFEVPLVQALLIMIRNTDGAIFSNPMMPQLEKQLRASNNELYKELVAQKELLTPNSLPPQLPNVVPTIQTGAQMYQTPVVQSDRDTFTHPVVQSDQVKCTSPVVQPERKRARNTSPDTTNLDNINKAVNGPVARTINFRTSPHAHQSFTSTSSMSNDSADQRPHIEKFRRYRPANMNNLHHVGMRYPRMMRAMPMGPIRPHLRHVIYAQRPPKFPQRHCPDSM